MCNTWFFPPHTDGVVECHERRMLLDRELRERNRNKGSERERNTHSKN